MKIHPGLLFLAASLAFGTAVFFLMRHLSVGPFVDEDNFINSAANFVKTGNYSTAPWPPYSAGISTLYWTNWPSGVARALGGSITQIRVVSFLYSFGLLATAVWLFIRNSGLAIVAVSFLFLYIPYNETFFRTLAEFPSVGFLGIGLALLSSQPFLAFAFLGVCTFGGKMVNFAFVLPILAMYFYFTKSARTQWVKLLLCFLSPFFLNMFLILVTQGPSYLFSWIADYIYNLGAFGKLGAGAQSSLSAPKVPLLQRWSDPRLEWVTYSYSWKIKILAFLFSPLILITFLRGRKLMKKNFILDALIVGQLIFAFWYFCLHPYMWIRHLQPALIVGMGILLWIAFEWVKKTRNQRGMVWLLAGLLAYFALQDLKLFLIKN